MGTFQGFTGLQVERWGGRTHTPYTHTPYRYPDTYVLGSMWLLILCLNVLFVFAGYAGYVWS